MTEHTPGPWTVKLTGSFADDGTPIVGVWIEAGEYTSLANLIPVQNVQANARLIAAAPELLEAAKAAVAGMPGGYDKAICHIGICTREECSQCRRIDGLRTAIAKAEGK